MVLNRFRFLITSILLILVLAACSAESNLVVEIPAKREVPLPTILPEPEPKAVLSICLGDEPGSLFLYGDQSLSARIIRQAIYDWTADEELSINYSAAIAEIPSLANQKVVLSEVEVADGRWIVDAHGNLTVLSRGTKYRPAGCSDPNCWETFDQNGPVIMDQVSVEFQLRDDLVWSDGTPLVPEDSIFSYQTAVRIYGNRGPAKLHYSSSYLTSEEGSVVWTGLPGYLGMLSYTDLFFDPLPSHLWENYSREDLLLSDSSTRFPIGWGGYRVVEWVPGDHITLYMNEEYQHQDELAFDALVFRFMPGPEEALAAYFSGECQIVANQPGLPDYIDDLRQAVEDSSVQITLSEARAWEQLSFGIDSISRSSDLLGAPGVRQALAGCVDRDKLSSRRLDSGGVANGFSIISANDRENEGSPLPFQPIAAGQDLRDLGWIDHDGDPDTPRLAEGVVGVPYGSSLDLVLLTVNTDTGISAANMIADGLRTCGVGVEVQPLPANELLAPGPDGPIFGRQFDLAYFAWAAGNYQPCRLYLSDEIPGIYPQYAKGWGGVNAPGYNSEQYDQACYTVLATLPDQDVNNQALAEIQSIYQEELPSLPLFFRRDIVLSSPQIRGISDGYLSELWYIENLEMIEIDD